MAVNFGSEKSPKSESESFSLTDFFGGFEIGFAMADFFGTARQPSVEARPFVFEPFFEPLFCFDFELFSASPASDESRDDPLRSFVARPFFNFLMEKLINAH